MMNFWTCSTIAFIVLSIIGVGLYKFFNIYDKLGAYIFLISGCIFCPIGGFLEIWTKSETVNWLHKTWGILSILAGLYFIIWLILFIKADLNQQKTIRENEIEK